ncbi:MAG: nucleoside triphosphate pyrophosphohydrolase [Alphaproteobacteria bacterium]|nr:nucleoside triphosphate pyrophosphohydrolase [Alphaproteobacteria bacterium]
MSTVPAPIDRLLDIMARLRDPVSGCPWDVEQNFATIAPYTIEEAYEVADAIERNDLTELREELGDLLLQVVFHARMAEEQGEFDFDDVAAGISDKMVRRHPHVFGGATVDDAESQTRAWEEQKAAERAVKAASDGEKSRAGGVLGGLPAALPALLRAYKLQKRAARVGFDWPDAKPVFDKIDEEVAEIKAELSSGDHDRLADEIGDLLFACANLARHLGVDPEDALRRTNAKFVRRFEAIETGLEARGTAVGDAGLEEMEKLWIEAKERERRNGAS